MAEALEAIGTTLNIGTATLCFVSLSGLGLDGGEKLDATSLDNTTWKTYLPQSLIDVPNLSFTAAYEPDEFAVLVSEINVNQSITLTFASPLGNIVFWGYLKSFTPAEAGVGERWTATGEIVVTNMNGSNVETGPVYSA